MARIEAVIHNYLRRRTRRAGTPHADAAALSRIVLETSGGYEQAGGRRLDRCRAARGDGQSATDARLRPQPQHPDQDQLPGYLGAGPLRRRGPAAGVPAAPECSHAAPARHGHAAPPTPSVRVGRSSSSATRRSAGPPCRPRPPPAWDSLAACLCKLLVP